MILSAFAIVFICYIICKSSYTSHADIPISVNKQIPYRGLLAIMIITDHLSQELYSPQLLWMFSWTGYIVVACFFAMSGYGLMERTTATQGKYLHHFFLKRVPKILVPFWLCNLVYTFVDNIFLLHRGSLVYNLSDVFGIKLINTNAWYVISLLVLYVIFWITHVSWFSTNSLIRLLTQFLLISVYGGICYFILHESTWMISNYAFLVGCLLSKYPVILKKISKWRLYITIISFAITYIGGWLVIEPKLNVILKLLAASVVAILFFKLNAHISINLRILEFLGTYSYEIYLMHNLFRKALIPIIKHSYITDTAYYLSILALTVVASIPIYYFSEWILTKYKKTILAYHLA